MEWQSRIHPATPHAAGDHEPVRTVGVEEELLVVDEAGRPVPLGPDALEVAARRGEGETAHQHDQDDDTDADGPVATEGERFARMLDTFGLTAQEMLTCGCHVHVSVEDDEEGVAVLNRIRVWLPVLTALTANSPYWQGRD